MLVIRGDGIIELTNILFKQRDILFNQTSSTIYASAGDLLLTNCTF
jgi:hypothetical protein